MATQGDERDGGARRADRGEDSVLFSLDRLQAMAQREREASRPPRVPAHFCGTQLHGLTTQVVAEPIVLAPLRAPQQPTASGRERLFLTRTIGLLLLTTIALGTYVAVDPRPRSVVTRMPAPEPMEAAVSIEPDDVELVPDASTSAGGEAAPPPSRLGPSEWAPIVEAVPTVRRRAAVGVRVHREPVRSQPAVDAAIPPVDGVPLQCVLEPNASGCSRGSATLREPVAREAPQDDPLLPETLSPSALRSGIATVKASAKQCAGRHGGTAGETVKIRLSIVGTTGAVQSTAAEGEYRGTALGNCVAAALKKASFPRFRKPVIGLEYTITL